MSKEQARPEEQAEDTEFRINDRRHWKVEQAESETVGEGAADPEPRTPSIIDEYRTRAEEAEAKLREYIEAFKSHEREQEAFRTRLDADVERRVNLKFGEVVVDLLEGVDDLDRGLAHVESVPQAEPLARGVVLARNRIAATLERHGVIEISPTEGAFDPNESEALRVDPVDSPERDGHITQVLRPGYRLGERVLRPAQVAVGRHVPAPDPG